MTFIEIDKMCHEADKDVGGVDTQYKGSLHRKTQGAARLACEETPDLVWRPYRRWKAV